MSTPPSNLIINKTFTEQEWLKQITDSLHLGPQSITQNLSSIFKVPTSISAAKPQSYTPQLVGLGPFHHFQRRLYPNEPIKLAGAHLALKRFNVPDLPTLIHQILPLLPNIRLFYDIHLHISDNTLAWLLAIDGMFVAEMLYNPQFLLPRTSNSFSFSERLRAITGDILLMENQIPIYSLFPPQISGNLEKMLESFCRVLSPFKLQDSSDRESKPIVPKHLLDHVYQLITRENKATLAEEEEGMSAAAENSVTVPIGKFKTLADNVAEKVDDANQDIGPAESVTAGILKLAQIQIKSPIGSIFKIFDILGISNFVNEVLDEDTTLVPSARDLIRVGVKFSATKGGLRSTDFNESDAVLTLPAFSLKPTSDLLIRNLVAYESLAKPDSAILTRYTEIMHAMIQDKDDAKLLRENGIVDGNGADVEEAVVALFRGMEGEPDPMSRTVMDRTVREVNAFYMRKSKVVASKVFKLIAKLLLRVLLFVVAMGLLVMFSVQTYCSLYVCGGAAASGGGGWFGNGSIKLPVGQSGGVSSL
ncbi:Putative UPF0481 protein At3g02645 [Linum grandiflorum]